MKSIAIVGERTLRELVPLDLAAIDCVQAAFASLATDPVAMPPVLRLDLPERHGEVDVKTAYLPRLGTFAVKVSPGFFNNPSLGLPSLNGLCFQQRLGKPRLYSLITVISLRSAQQRRVPWHPVG